MRIMHISRATLMVCQFLIPLIEEQKKKGHHVYVCGSDDSDSQKLKDMDIDFFPHQLARNLSPLQIIKGILQLKKLLIEKKIDVIICHAPIAGGVGRIAAKFAKTSTIIYFVHGYTCAPAQHAFKWMMWFCVEKLLGNITDAALVMNDYDEKLCRKYRMLKNMNKLFRIPGIGVDLEKFTPDSNEIDRKKIEKEFCISSNTSIIVSLAYLIPEKGIFVLLEAARRIKKNRKDFCFLLAGKGPCMTKLKKLCSKYNLEKYFRILGWRDDVHHLLRSADIFVLPSYYWEGLPVSILEAMSCGKPVIATNNRGCKDTVLNGETGFLIPLRDPGSLSDKILTLLDDHQLQKAMGKKGRQRIERYFGLNFCTEKIIEALGKAIC